MKPAKIEKVLEILKSRSTNIGVEDGYIKWTENGMNFSIYVDDIDIENEKAAWFQTDENSSRQTFKLFENNDFFDIVPTTDHPGYGCDVYLVEWFEGHLILIYHEKHNIVVSTIKDKNIKTFQFHGDSLIRKDDKLYYSPYAEQEYVRILQIPTLLELEPLSITQAAAEGVIPQTLGYANSLKNK